MRRPARALMRGAVDPARHSADDRKTALGEIASQPLRHLIPVGRRAPRADHRDRMPVEHARISANVKQRRRIVNFEETLRIFRFVPVQQQTAEFADPREFFFRVLA